MVKDPDGIAFFVEGDLPEPTAPGTSVFGSTAFDRLDQLFTVDGLDEIGSAVLPDDITVIPAVMADGPEVVAELHAEIGTVLAEQASVSRKVAPSTFEQVVALAEAAAPMRQLDPSADFIVNGPRVDVRPTRRFGRKGTTTSSKGAR